MNWHEYFTYNPETGDLIWKERDRADFKTNQAYLRFAKASANRPAGARAYTIRRTPLGIKTKLFGKQLYAHRIIWEMHKGQIPEKMIIDHINGNPWNNRIENLRLASRAENVRNSKIPSSNTSGFKGVQRSGNKWKASIVFNGKYIFIGTFDEKEKAGIAYFKEAKRLFGEFARFS